LFSILSPDFKIKGALAKILSNQVHAATIVWGEQLMGVFKWMIGVLCFVSFGLQENAEADAEIQNCNEVQLNLGLQAGSMPACHDQEIQGNFRLRRCPNGRGVLISDQGRSRLVFLFNGQWQSRGETIDFNSGQVRTEVFIFEPDLKSFIFQEVKSKDGSMIESLACSGTVN